MDDRTPILVGAGQRIQRDVDPAVALDPLALMAEAASAAAEDAGGGARLLTAVDSVAVVNVFSWDYGNAPRLLAERVGAHARDQRYTTVGGNTPQSLVNQTAARIAGGEVGLALVAGGEAIATLRRARGRVAWAVAAGTPPVVVGEARPGTTEYEVAHNFQLPTQIYPLFENALRARSRLPIDEHRARLGRLMARFSAVAAENPYAWFREARSADEIVTATARNRMIGFPYTKYMNAIIEVDQAAAVLMTSVGRARALGIPASRWVHVLGTAEAHDHWFVSERVNYWSSPAIRAAAGRALALAGVSSDAIDWFDLYSCFPCAVEIGRDMLGIADDDPRPLTVTGGLPYFGGPGNAYSLHAIASMMDRLRASPGTRGLVTALGWYLTKHAVAVYAASPDERGWHADPGPSLQDGIDREPRPEIAAQAEGPATIETYTVLHDRDGAPVSGLVVGRLDDDRRFLANTPVDRDLLESLVVREGVGLRGTVSVRDGLNRFVPD